MKNLKLYLILLFAIFISPNIYSQYRILIDELVNKGEDEGMGYHGCKDMLLYNNGKLYNGIAFDVYKNGEIKIEGSIQDGKMNGKWSKFDQEGMILRETYFVNGIDTLRKSYNLEDIPLTVERNIKENSALCIRYYANGQKLSQGQYNGDNEEGLWKAWYENGKIKGETGFDDGELSGVYRYYYESNGNLRTEFFQKDEIPYGTWKNWYENGQLKDEMKYNTNGTIKYGIYSTYYVNGDLESQSEYVNNIIIWDRRCKDYQSVKGISITSSKPRLSFPSNATNNSVNELITKDLLSSESVLLNNFEFTLNNPLKGALNFKSENGKLICNSPIELSAIPMPPDGNGSETYTIGEDFEISGLTLITIDSKKFMIYIEYHVDNIFSICNEDYYNNEIINTRKTYNDNNLVIELDYTNKMVKCWDIDGKYIECPTFIKNSIND